MTTYNVSYCAAPAGVPGLAVRLGQALENWGRTTWGRRAAQPVDPAAVRFEQRRQEHEKLRMLSVARVGLQHW